MRNSGVFVACLLFPLSLFAGFASTETYLAAVGRVPGQGGAQFYTTVWASNLTTVQQTLTFQFLKQGQANPSPASFQDTLQPGETKVYENVVETKLGLTNAIGAARVTSTGDLRRRSASTTAPGDDVGRTEGLFFAGVPKSFRSPPASLPRSRDRPGGSEKLPLQLRPDRDGGGSPTVNVQRSTEGGLARPEGSRSCPTSRSSPTSLTWFLPIHTTNARITATVTGGAAPCFWPAPSSPTSRRILPGSR
jgi:hypothetical protein